MQMMWHLKPELRLLYFSGSKRGAEVHSSQLIPGKQQFTKGVLKMGTRPSEGDPQFLPLAMAQWLCTRWAYKCSHLVAVTHLLKLVVTSIEWVSEFTVDT